MNIRKNQRGQSLIEYVILVALIGIGTMGMVGVLQKTVKENLHGVINGLQGTHATSPKYEALTTHDLRKTDFSNFWQGTRSGDRADR